MDKNLRTIELDGEPWFHASDTCRILGLSVSGGSTPHTARLNADEKRTLSKRTHGQALGAAEFFGVAGLATAVNESGLYKLIMRSDKDTA